MMTVPLTLADGTNHESACDSPSPSYGIFSITWPKRVSTSSKGRLEVLQTTSLETDSTTDICSTLTSRPIMVSISCALENRELCMLTKNSSFRAQDLHRRRQLVSHRQGLRLWPVYHHAPRRVRSQSSPTCAKGVESVVSTGATAATLPKEWNILFPARCAQGTGTSIHNHNLGEPPTLDQHRSTCDPTRAEHLGRRSHHVDTDDTERDPRAQRRGQRDSGRVTRVLCPFRRGQHCGAEADRVEPSI